jgi:hypothetical protein
MSTRKNAQPEAKVVPEKTLVQKLFWPALIILAFYVGVMAYQEAFAEDDEPVLEAEIQEAIEEEPGFFGALVDRAVARADDRLDAKRAELEEFEDTLDERETLMAERESESSIRYGSIVRASTDLQECALNALKEVSDAQPPIGS